MVKMNSLLFLTVLQFIGCSAYWTQIANTYSPYIIAMNGTGANQVYSTGYVYKSTNYGATWTSTNSPAAGGALATNGQYIIAGSSSGGGLSVSSNFGTSWGSTQFTNCPYTGGAMSTSGKYMYMSSKYSYGYTGALLRSSNYGSSFTFSSSFTTTVALYDVACSSNGMYVVTLGTTGALLSTNYGSTFNPTLYTSAVHMNNVACDQYCETIAVGLANGDGIYLTQNFGNNWYLLPIAGVTYTNATVNVNMAGNLVMVVLTGGTGGVYQYSTVTQQWTNLNAPSGSNFISGAMDATGTIMSIGAYGGSLYTYGTYGSNPSQSPTFFPTLSNTWTTTNVSNPWASLASVGDNGQMFYGVSVSSNVGASGVYISYDLGWSYTEVLTVMGVALGGVITNHNGSFAIVSSGTSYYVTYNTGVSWTLKSVGYSIYSMGMSHSGQYVVFNLYGFLSISSNYGATFTSVTLTSSITSSAVSGNGQYVVAVTGDGMYISNAYGADGTFVLNADVSVGSVALSNDGQYMAATSGGGMIISNNFGTTWTPSDNIYGILSFTMSANGQIVTCGTFYGIFTSTNFGYNFTNPFVTGSLYYVSMDYAGVYQIASSQGPVNYYINYDNSILPTTLPTVMPTTTTPSLIPTMMPTTPTVIPTVIPTIDPSVSPSHIPTISPTFIPTKEPSIIPTAAPSITPSLRPSERPSLRPSVKPTLIPTVEPSAIPTNTAEPTNTALPTTTSVPTNTGGNVNSNGSSSSSSSGLGAGGVAAIVVVLLVVAIGGVIGYAYANGLWFFATASTAAAPSGGAATGASTAAAPASTTNPLAGPSAIEMNSA